MNVLSSLEPKKVFEYFEAISAVPRGSGNTDAISSFCVDFADKHGLRSIRDETGNVIIFKDGSAGRENEEPVILQGHMDMVWEKEPGSDFDFENCGISLMIDGDYITADGTTLGGDDGIAVAVCLSILDDDSLSHPPLEVIFTVDEEVGMTGARALDTSVLRGHRMINLDSESEDVLWVSCAGGARADIDLPLKKEENDLPAYRITVTGLHGGHSGAEIHKHYANATVLAGRILYELNKKYGIKISDIQGGKMDNAITRECTAVVVCGNSIADDIADFENKIKKEFASSDPDIKIICEKTGAAECFASETNDAAIKLLSSLPFGVIAMSREIEGLVETSLNPGICSTGDKLHIGWAVRSSVNADKQKLLTELKELADSCKADYFTYGDYPAWEYKKDSCLRDTMVSVYEELYGKHLQVTAIHAGLECGIFNGKIDNFDCVSIGPDMLDIHTANEKLSIPSSKRVYDFVVKTLERI